MDSGTRKAALARDGAVARINSVTWKIGTASLAGALVLVAGFAHLLPTRLPTFGIGRGAGGGQSNGSGGGLQGPVSGPGPGSGPGHVRSGGS